LKRGQTTIILSILVVSMFIFGFTPTKADTSYQALVTGDQLLYKNVFYFYDDLEQKLFHELDVADNWWIIDHWDYIYDEMESYYITSIDTTSAYANYAWTLYDRYNNKYGYDQYYNYTDSTWNLNNSYSDYEQVVFSNFEPNREYYVYDGIVNFDATDWFVGGFPDYSEVKYYVINGINSSYNVDVYIESYDEEITTPYTYEGINFDETNPWGYVDTFYVDSETGFLLEYTSYWYDHYYRTINHKNSPNLGCFVDYYYNNTYMWYYTWQLDETTAAYSPVGDADLPAMQIDTGYNYELRGNNDYVPIYFDLINKYPYMTIDVLLDGVLVDTIYNVATGPNTYELSITSIPYVEGNHTVIFNVYDDFNFAHNTTWSLDLVDLRLDWPVISGPAGEYSYLIGNFEVLEWEFNDYYGNGNYFELRIDGILDDRSDYWVNGTRLYLDLSKNITSAGDHLVQISAVDTNFYITELYLTIHASEPVVDTTNPTITGTTSGFSMNEGDTNKIVWEIYDENPSSYEVKLNGSTYLSDNSWTKNTEQIVIELSTFDAGVWSFELIVIDAYSNTETITVEITINEVITTDPTDPTDPTSDPSGNTLTLDASSWIYTALSLASFVTLVAIYRKRR